MEIPQGKLPVLRIAWNKQAVKAAPSFFLYIKKIKQKASFVSLKKTMKYITTIYNVQASLISSLLQVFCLLALVYCFVLTVL